MAHLKDSAKSDPKGAQTGRLDRRIKGSHGPLVYRGGERHNSRAFVAL
ncbi:hypothetical protein AK972_4522 [Pseudomonas yamanorum]|nr:hypothetical protein AK972_4522 [Pseudomonas yamanorum]